MLLAITITPAEILHQMKLSYQMPKLIEEIITRKIIQNAAEKANITVEKEELQAAADRFRFLNKLQQAEKTQAWLEKHYLSVDDFEELVYTNLLSVKLATTLFSSQIKPYFFEHRLDYAGAIIYEVILENEDLAIELFYAIKEGEISFAEVAHQYIQDTELRRRGGYRGKLKRKNMNPAISAAVFAVNAPQLLQPIVTTKGTHLIYVEEIIYPQLDKQLRQKILEDLFTNWLEQALGRTHLKLSENDKLIW